MRILGLTLAFALILAAGGSGLRAQGTPPWFGAAFETVTPESMTEHGLSVPFGARVTAVETDSPAAKAGLAQGDVVISINGNPVNDAPALKQAIENQAVGSALKLNRMRGKEVAAVTVKLIKKPRPPSETTAAAPTRLMLDTGGHRGRITDLTFTPDDKFIISTSDDKVIRVWDWKARKTVRMIRGESGPGNEGKVFSLALSPDGTRLAVGGYFSGKHQDAIRLFDVSSGRLLHLLMGHKNIVNALAFAPDGRHLISGGSEGIAIVWDVPADADNPPKLLHRLKGHTDLVYAVHFTPDSKRAVTGSNDKTLKLWNVKTGELLAKMEGHKRPIERGVAIRKSDGLIASGDTSGEIRLWDGTTGKFIKVLTNQQMEVSDLIFTPDGKRLVSGAAKRTSDSRPFLVNVWDVESATRVATYGGHDNNVLAAAITSDGRYVASAGGTNFEIDVWDINTGAPVNGEDNKPITLSGKGISAWAAGFTDDSNSIGWGYTFTSDTINNRGPFEYILQLPLNERVLSSPKSLNADATANGLQEVGNFRRISVDHSRYQLSHRSNQDGGYNSILDIREDGKLVASLEHDLEGASGHYAYGFSADKKSIISGAGHGEIYVFDIEAVISAAKTKDQLMIRYWDFGKVARTFIGHESAVWAVAPSPDGRFLMSAAADQTIRLWNLRTNELIVTFLHGTDGEWVMWTPQGYYTGSPGGGELVGWQINKGPANAAEYVRGRQLRQKLLRPDIVERAIVLGSAEAALKEAGLENASIEKLLTQTPPVIFARAAKKHAAGGRGIIYVASEENKLPILEAKITVSDGKQETVVETRSAALPAGITPPERGTVQGYEVPLFKGINKVRVIARNAAGESEPREIEIIHNGEGALDKRETLWVLAVGANKYPGVKRIKNPSDGKFYRYKDLKYAVPDATAFAKTVADEMTGRHKKVNVKLLVNGGEDGEPTKTNIVAALQHISENSTANDTIAILLAGHGENWEGGRYHFLPTDVKRSLISEIGENVLDWQADIHPLITAAKGRKILFLDACHSGNAYNKTLLAEADADRFVAFSAAGPGEEAFELQGHGAFTSTLLKALAGANEALDRFERGVTIYSLGDYVNTEVRRQTAGRQTPEFRSGQGNFVLTRQ